LNLYFVERHYPAAAEVFIHEVGRKPHAGNAALRRLTVYAPGAAFPVILRIKLRAGTGRAGMLKAEKVRLVSPKRVSPFPLALPAVCPWAASDLTQESQPVLRCGHAQRHNDGSIIHDPAPAAKKKSI
jgi:hypothetical protein